MKNLNSGIYYLAVIVIATAFLGIGYARITDREANVTGRISAAAQTGIVISEMTYSSSVNANPANSEINTYYQTLIDSTITLNNAADSSITYQVKVTNLGNVVKKYIETVYDPGFYDNNDITYEISGLTYKTPINPGETLTFYITFKYRENKDNYPNTTLNSYINIVFEEIVDYTYWITGSDVSSKMLSLAGNRNNIHDIVEATEAEYNSVKNSLTDNNIISTDDSDVPTYMWYSNNKIYYYSSAPKYHLNPNCANMFASLSKVVSIDMANFNTSNVTNMTNMFKDCSKLTTLDFSSFNTAKVTSMNSMFWKDVALERLDLSSFRTPELTDIYGMFYNCTLLSYLDVSNFNTSKVTNMASSFGNLRNLQDLDLSNFNTSQVTNMANMFNGSTGIINLNVSSFDTSRTTNLSRMFASMENLEILDISNFDTSSATNLDKMFTNMYKVQTIYVSNLFTTSRYNSTTIMFQSSPLLVGGNGTVFSDSNANNKTYAVIDTDTTPGYFTEKSPG